LVDRPDQSIFAPLKKYIDLAFFVSFWGPLSKYLSWQKKFPGKEKFEIYEVVNKFLNIGE
tara:strand:+ start:2398 stop:2577 length:180 start_codon:yes stop_codon:yes gene_type:complete